jgi:hypothetical protein
VGAAAAFITVSEEPAAYAFHPVAMLDVGLLGKSFAVGRAARGPLSIADLARVAFALDQDQLGRVAG